MPIDFPFPASANDSYSYEGTSWLYDGTGWRKVRGGTGPTGPTGSVGATGAVGPTGFDGGGGTGASVTGFAVGSNLNLNAIFVNPNGSTGNLSLGRAVYDYRRIHRSEFDGASNTFSYPGSFRFINVGGQAIFGAGGLASKDSVGYASISTLTGGRAAVATQGSNYLIGASGSTFLQVYGLLLSPSNNTNAFFVSVGFSDNVESPTGASTHALLRHTHTLNGGRWTASVLGPSGMTERDTGITARSQGQPLHDLKIEIPKGCTAVNFYVDGSLVHQETQVLPYSNVGVGAYAGIMRDTTAPGTANRPFHIDYMVYEKEVFRGMDESPARHES